MITVTGQVTLDDYIRAQLNHSRKYNITFIVLFAIFAMLVALIGKDYIFPGFIFAYLAIRPFYMRARCKRFWKRTPSIQNGSQTWGFDDSGFHTEDDEGNPNITHWDKFIKWRESKDTLFLYLSPRLFVFLPKRFAGVEYQNQIKQLLMEKIKQTPGRI